MWCKHIFKPSFTLRQLAFFLKDPCKELIATGVSLKFSLIDKLVSVNVAIVISSVLCSACKITNFSNLLHVLP